MPVSPDRYSEELEQEAKRLFEINSKDYRNAPPWEELHEDTREIWRDFAKKRLDATQHPPEGK